MMTLTLPVTILFIINGIISFDYSLKLKKIFPQHHNLYTSAATAILWIVAGIAYPFLLPEDAMLEAAGSIIIAFLTPLIIFSILFFEKRVIARNPVIAVKRSFDNFLKKFTAEKAKAGERKQDLRRKALHFIPPLLILLIRILTIDKEWMFSKALIIIAGYAGVLFFSALDFIMHSFVYGKKSITHLLPDKVSDMLARTMKRQEFYEPLKVVPLVLGLLPSLLFPFSIFLSTALVSSLSDGAASVSGHFLGKIHFPKKSKKTLAGYAAGAVTAFFLITASCFVFDSLPHGSIFLLSLAGALAFLIIDIANTKIDDNVLNPLLVGFALGIAYATIQ